MSSLTPLIQEAQKLHYQLALSSSAVFGHLEGHGVNQDSVYTVAIYEQMGDNTKTAGRLLDQLCSLAKPEAAPVQVVTDANSNVSGSNGQSNNGVVNQVKTTALLNIEDELNLVVEEVSIYESIGLENNEPTVTGNEVSVLMGRISNQLRPIVEHIKQLHSNAMA